MSSAKRKGMTTSQSQTSLEPMISKKANTGQTTSSESTMNGSLQEEVRKMVEWVRQLKADFRSSL